MIMKFAFLLGLEGISCTQMEMGGVIEWTRSCWKGYVFSPDPVTCIGAFISVDDNGFIQIIETGSLE